MKLTLAGCKPARQRTLQINVVRPPGVLRNIAQRRSELGTVATLTGMQHDSLLEFYDRWCYDPPTFRSVPTDEPGFDLALHCRVPHAYVESWRIPVDEIAPDLIALIETVPPLTCADPFCGWREVIIDE